MEAYTSFASVYDIFMDNIPYDEWAKYVVTILKKYQIEDGLVLDLGCGTGTLTELLSQQGYDMIGIDNSEDMLEVAMDKRIQSEYDILYLLQDMREFELYGTVRAIVSICDSINYITEDQELLTVFQLVNNYLDPKGIFLFDFNTTYKYKEILGDQTIAESREDCSFIWNNYYDESENMNEYELHLFLKEHDNYYRKYEEIHIQKAYELSRVKELIEKAGMLFITACDADTKETPTELSQRIYVIAQEQGK
ncbi:MAG: methyltransferase domain-containing protein [Lachnospiraceae bacterium]